MHGFNQKLDHWNQGSASGFYSQIYSDNRSNAIYNTLIQTDVNNDKGFLH